MANFSDFDLPKPLIESLRKLNFTTPTPIQERAIPIALQGTDILGSAQTGTGKTIAFGVPMITKLLTDLTSCALVLVPTRELATQVVQALQALIHSSANIKTVLLIGGNSITTQIHQLKTKPRLFVGTPGRINDHLERGTLNLHNVKFLVLDETDRMLDMGFSIQIERILKFLPKTRQTLLFSATLPPTITKIANNYLSNPERISVGMESQPAPNIKQDILHITEEQKYNELLSQLTQRNGSIIVFVKTKFGAAKIAKKLQLDHHTSDAIHGDLRHTKRESVIKAFRNSKYRILVATDLAARGLDIPHIEHVINFDLPQCPEDYIHRIGRTARAGATGESLCFITPQDRIKWGLITRLMNPNDKSSHKPSATIKTGTNARINKKKPFSATRNEPTNYNKPKRKGPYAR